MTDIEKYSKIIADFMSIKNSDENTDWYHKWDSIIPVIEKIHTDYLKCGIEGRDLIYTINNLLGGGYKFGNNTPLPKLEMSTESLFIRAGMFIEHKLKQ